MTPAERFTCTAADPWTPDEGKAIHPDAKDIGECADSCCDKYKCPHCGLVFYVEVAQ